MRERQPRSVHSMASKERAYSPPLRPGFVEPVRACSPWAGGLARERPLLGERAALAHPWYLRA